MSGRKDGTMRETAPLTSCSPPQPYRRSIPPSEQTSAVARTSNGQPANGQWIAISGVDPRRSATQSARPTHHFVDTKDGADVDTGVDVGRAVEGVEHDAAGRVSETHGEWVHGRRGTSSASASAGYEMSSSTTSPRRARNRLDVHRQTDCPPMDQIATLRHTADRPQLDPAPTH
jgi:hypothetical protein